MLSLNNDSFIFGEVWDLRIYFLWWCYYQATFWPALMGPYYLFHYLDSFHSILFQVVFYKEHVCMLWLCHMTYDLKVFNLKYFHIILLFMIQFLICLAFSLCPSFLLLSSFGFPENTLFLSLSLLAWKSRILSHLTTRIRENPEFTPLPPTVPHMSALYLVSMRPWNAAAVSNACNYYLFFYLCLNPQN